jgi:glutamine amidotransferase
MIGAGPAPAGPAAKDTPAVQSPATDPSDPNPSSPAVAVVVVDYGAGNLRSVRRALEHAGATVIVSAEARVIAEAQALVLPGVGAAADTMEKLRERGLVEPLLQAIRAGRPFLGVCMGMQALFDLSAEGGSHPCLGVLPGRVVRFPAGASVPHMGWNTIEPVVEHPLLAGLSEEEHAYFVHSYYPAPDDPTIVVAETEYGVRFPSVVAKGNVMATQFHPEKSGRAGLRIYENFVTLVREQNQAPATATPGVRTS